MYDATLIRPSAGHTARPLCSRVLLLALLLGCAALAGCVSGSVGTRARPPLATFEFPAAEPSAVTLHALGLVGTPYRWGGNTPEGGFDCSGLIGYLYRSDGGVQLPRTVARLASVGQHIDIAGLRGGDLVLFGAGRTPTHAGIYVGAGRFVHAPSSGGTVRLDRLQSPHWAREFIEFRRP